MEAVLFLLALAAITGVLVVPALRRRRLARGTGPSPFTPADPARYGLVPPERLDVRLPGPDDELIEALEETQRTQDWRPVARLLALTGDDWELRWQRVQSLAGAATVELAGARVQDPDAPPGGAGAAGPSLSKEAPRRDAGWLRNWRAQEPGSADGAQVYAQFLVWQARAGTGTADSRIILEEARAICREASRTAPDDPTPYVVDLVVARALGDRPADFEALWERTRGRAPHHMGAHLEALRYWSEEWHGSRDDAYAFAQEAAGSAPEGSLLPALPLFAVHDHLPEANMVRGLYRSAVVERAVAGAQYALHHVRPRHPMVPHVRHLLLLFLVRAERYAEAVEQLRAVDGYVGAAPWTGGGDPVAAYTAYRALAIAGYEAQGGGATTAPPTH